MTKTRSRKPVRSGHGDTVKRKLTAAQNRTLKNRGQIDVTITLDGTTYYKTVRRRNIRAGAWEYYRRSAAVPACGAWARQNIGKGDSEPCQQRTPQQHSADQPPNIRRQGCGGEGVKKDGK
jgi:hypothetical protein